jgi:hypothetical protein
MRVRTLVLFALLIAAPAAFADCQNCVTYDGNNWNCSLAWTGAPGGAWGQWNCQMFLQGQYWNCYLTGDWCYGGECPCDIDDCRPCIMSRNCPAKTQWKLVAVTTHNRDGMEMVRLASAQVEQQATARFRQALRPR